MPQKLKKYDINAFLKKIDSIATLNVKLPLMTKMVYAKGMFLQ